MNRYVWRRILEILPTTVGVIILTFLLFHVVGGSPAEIVLGKNATAEALADFDAQFGYDKPLLFGRWTPIRALGHVLKVESSTLNVERSNTGSQTSNVQHPTSNVQHVGGGLHPIPLTYALPEGGYRINARTILLRLRNIETGETDEMRVEGGGASLTFRVRGGWKAVEMDVGGGLPKTLKLEKQNANVFDSQFLNYCLSLAKRDLGTSTEHKQPVAEVLRAGVWPSLALTVPILVFGTLIGVLLGLLCAAWRGGGTDKSVLVISTVLMSVNYVVWVLAGQFILAYKLRLFPIWGFESAVYIALPVIIGIISGLGRDVRFFRAAILDEVYKPYVRTAQAKGLGGWRIMIRHVLHNSLIPIVTYVSLSIPFLFTGSLLLESFFGIPGLGNVSLNAIHSSDMAVVRAVVILGALLYQVVNLLTDLCYAWLDPRVRLG